MIKIPVQTINNKIAYINLPSDLSEITLESFVHYHSVLKQEDSVFDAKKQQLLAEIAEIESDIDEWIGSHKKRRLEILAEKKALLNNFSQTLSPVEVEQLTLFKLKVISFFAKEKLEKVGSNSVLLQQLDAIYEQLYHILEYYNTYALLQHNSQQIVEFTHKQETFFIHRPQVKKTSNGSQEEELFSTLNFADYIGLLTVNEAANSKALESVISNVRAGNMQDLLWLLPYLARKKGEVLPVERPKRYDILQKRYEFFKDIPADIVLNVSWFFFAFNKPSAKNTK